MADQNTELQSNLLEELSDSELEQVRGGAGISLTINAAVLVPDALGVLEDVETGN